MPPATRQRQPKRPQDFTGRERERLAAQHAEDVARRADEVAMVQQTEAEAAENEVTDLTEPEQKPAEQSGPVEVRKTHRVIRLNSDLDDMTYGHGNTYSFKRGQQYKVHADLADHLDRLGFVWH